jgi:SAM-dependent methyltransferase
VIPVHGSTVDQLVELRRFWDDDAATYDQWPEHAAWSKGERAAWAATLASLLPAGGAHVLDVGAGTGFLSLAAARLGYKVTALDISARMLCRLEESAAREGLSVEVVCAPANEPPSGPFDAVMERLLLWTLPDPVATLSVWRDTVPSGPLLAFECRGGGRIAVARSMAWSLVRRLRGRPPEHHGPYPEALRTQLSMRGPEAFISFIERSGWRDVEMMPLEAVKFARQIRQRRLGRVLGVTQEYAIRARSGR